MTEPVTNNLSLIVPNTGDLVAAWGTSALNPNFVMIDSRIGGTTTISLSSATTIVLSALSTSGIATTTIPQVMNAMITFTGTLSGSSVIRFTAPGMYVINNRCLATTHYIQLTSASGAGNVITAPPGRKTQVFYDGTDMDYIGLGEPGAALDLSIPYLPVWMQACTVAPYLLKNGATYSTSAYPALAAVLGSTFGGNGVTTFGVPDERGRMSIGWDYNNTGRVAGASGINAATMGSAGGNEYYHAHYHAAGIYDPTHRHYVSATGLDAVLAAGAGGSGVRSNGVNGVAFYTDYASTGVRVNSTNGLDTTYSAGLGGSQNMPPSIVSRLCLIKT